MLAAIFAALVIDPRRIQGAELRARAHVLQGPALRATARAAQAAHAQGALAGIQRQPIIAHLERLPREDVAEEARLAHGELLQLLVCVWHGLPRAVAPEQG